MTFTSNYIRTEGNGRLRCQGTARVAHRQLEASIGTVVIVLAVGFAAMVSQVVSGNAAKQPQTIDRQVTAIERSASLRSIHASVRIIPVFSQSADRTQSEPRI